jgi:hypothetical protein
LPQSTVREARDRTLDALLGDVAANRPARI